MVKLLLLGALLSAPVTYQEKVFEPSESESGTLSPGELACLSSGMTIFYPAEREIDFLGVRFARLDEDRSQACAIFTVERSEPIETFLAGETEPTGVYFTGGGETAVWRETLERVCVPRGQLNPVVSCLNTYYTVRGQVSLFDVRRDNSAEPASVLEVWEVVTKDSANYADKRATGKAKSHTKE